MNNDLHTTATKAHVARRRTLDGFHVELYQNGDVCHGGGTFTRHRLPLSAAWEVMEAVSLFERAEMPHLIASAAKLARRGVVDFWSLVNHAHRASHKAGTRPADMPAPKRTVRIAVWTPAELRLRRAGAIVMPRETVAMEVDA